MGTPQNSSIEDQLTLEYCGPLVAKGRMNSYDVATYIMAFSDFLGVASRTAYGEQITINTEIQGFRKDSFDIDFIFYLGVVTAHLFTQTPLTIKDFIDLIRGCIKLWMHLGGKSPKAVIQDPQKKNIMQVENQNGQIIYATADVINIISDLKAGEAAERFIKKPMEADISYVRINSKSSAEVAKIEKKDAPSFVPITIEEPSNIEQEMEMTLLVESPVFKEGNKWRFSDGQNSFHADILDEDFLKKVDLRKERFGKGDQLKAKVRFIQSGKFGSLKLDRTIIKVLEHQIPTETGNLFKPDPSNK